MARAGNDLSVHPRAASPARPSPNHPSPASPSHPAIPSVFSPALPRAVPPPARWKHRAACNRPNVPPGPFRPGRAAIAVGTALAGGPPRRSQRALLAHWAPASGTGVESDVRPGMRDAGGREPPCFEPAHPLPGHPVALAAAPKRPVPVPRDLFSECRHCVDVAGNRVVGGVPAHHAAQPLSLLWDGPVTALPEQGVHLAQLGRHLLRDRL